MHPMLNIAFQAARKAGDLIAKCYETPDASYVRQRGVNNFVINVNREAERLIIEVIRKYYPHHTIIGEDSDRFIDKHNEIQWIVIPLNGSTNFIKRFPHFAVSIAVRIKCRTEVAVVYDPIRNELFTAIRGQGAQLNGYRMRGGVARNLDGTILATSFPLKQKQHLNSYFSLISKLFIQCAEFRYTGSAALDLAYVAAGRVDGFFEIGMKIWDFAGGELLVREAGGLVTDFTGGHNYLLSGNVMAGNPRVVKAMLSTLRTEFN